MMPDIAKLLPRSLVPKSLAYFHFLGEILLQCCEQNSIFVIRPKKLEFLFPNRFHTSSID
jgi:hypothetical protein